MYYRFPQRYNYLTVDDDFAMLQGVNDAGDATFRLFYTVSQQDAVTQGAMTVNVTVFSRTIQRKPLLQNTQPGLIDTVQLVRNVLSSMPDAKSAIKQQVQFVIATQTSDISAFINNEVIGQLRANVPTNNIPQLVKPVLSLVSAGSIKEASDVQPVLTLSAHALTTDTMTVLSASTSDDQQGLMHDMIVRQGIDPSFVTQLTPRSMQAPAVVGGLTRVATTQELITDPATRLLNTYLFPTSDALPALTSDLQDSDYVQVLDMVAQDNLEIPVTIVIPGASRQVDGDSTSSFFVRFDLIQGSTNAAIDTVTLSLDVASHIQVLFTPKVPPIVTSSGRGSSPYVNLEIKQVDPVARSVQVYRKTFPCTVTDPDEYTLIGTYNLRSSDQSMHVAVEAPVSSPVIYRVIPMGPNGTLASTFTNIVLGPQRYVPNKALSLTTQVTAIGVQIEARHIPQQVAAIEFLVRNRTTFEKPWRNAGGDVVLIDATARSTDYASIVDLDVSPNNIYEYAARLIHDAGSTSLAGRDIVEFIRPEPGKVDTIISDLVVTASPSPNITFTVATTVVDSATDVVAELLAQAGLTDEFAGDLAKESAYFKSLIAHNIERVDLTAGVRESFGVVTTPAFDNNALGKNQVVSPIDLTHRYRYDVTALLRAPETMLPGLVKQAIDPVTKKSYSFSPARFLQPLTLNAGVLVSQQGLRTMYAKQPMLHGAIGSVVSTEVSFNAEPATVLDASASRFDRSLNTITWSVLGDINNVDHFILMKDAQGVRTVIGRAHCEFVNGSCQYLHRISSSDQGAFVYVITPVFSDYKVGTEAQTNTVVV